MRLKLKFQGQVERFQTLSQQVARYVAPQIWESIFSGKRQAKLETQRKKLVIFFSDIVGFSALSEQMEAEAFTDLLNQYLTDMSSIAMRYGGTIDKFIGDGMMIFFGDPTVKAPKATPLPASPWPLKCVATCSNYASNGLNGHDSPTADSHGNQYRLLHRG